MRVAHGLCLRAASFLSKFSAKSSFTGFVKTVGCVKTVGTFAANDAPQKNRDLNSGNRSAFVTCQTATLHVSRSQFPQDLRPPPPSQNNLQTLKKKVGEWVFCAFFFVGLRKVDGKKG